MTPNENKLALVSEVGARLLNTSTRSSADISGREGGEMGAETY